LIYSTRDRIAKNIKETLDVQILGEMESVSQAFEREVIGFLEDRKYDVSLKEFSEFKARHDQGLIERTKPE
jgi:hypothetical protein